MLEVGGGWLLFKKSNKKEDKLEKSLTERHKKGFQFQESSREDITKWSKLWKNLATLFTD